MILPWNREVQPNVFNVQTPQRLSRSKRKFAALLIFSERRWEKLGTIFLFSETLLIFFPEILQCDSNSESNLEVWVFSKKKIQKTLRDLEKFWLKIFWLSCKRLAHKQTELLKISKISFSSLKISKSELLSLTFSLRTSKLEKNLRLTNFNRSSLPTNLEVVYETSGLFEFSNSFKTKFSQIW